MRSQIALLLVCLCAFLKAQEPIGTLEGQITDPSAAAVNGAEVSVHNGQTGLTRTLRSARDGSFHFANLPVGDYGVAVRADGFAAYNTPVIRIDIGKVVTLPIELQVASAHNEISVIGEAVMVDTSPTLGNVV